MILSRHNDYSAARINTDPQPFVDETSNIPLKGGK
jgi:hypothetical protein